MLGSVTTTASVAPARELITGQPMPGEPSQRMVVKPLIWK